MGKCGAGELNYISDVDVIYVLDAPGLDEAQATRIGTFLASGISRGVYSPGIEPALWEVDANLRPEGRDGPLVRTLESHLSYYERWAQMWEFQALQRRRSRRRSPSPAGKPRPATLPTTSRRCASR